MKTHRHTTYTHTHTTHPWRHIDTSHTQSHTPLTHTHTRGHTHRHTTHIRTYIHTPPLGLQAHTITSGLFMWYWEWNSGPHACATGTLPLPMAVPGTMISLDFTVVKGPHGQKEAFRLRIFACPPPFPHGLQAVVFGFCYRGKSSQCQKVKCPENPHDIPEQHLGFQNAGREPCSACTKKMCPSTPAVRL